MWRKKGSFLRYAGRQIVVRDFFIFKSSFCFWIFTVIDAREDSAKRVIQYIAAESAIPFIVVPRNTSGKVLDW